MATFYIATDGNDNNIGTLSQPWATWQKGCDEALPGDTVYVRGGVYYLTGNDPFVRVDTQAWGGAIGASGTAANPIRFWAYPSDYAAGNFPILDCINAYETYGTNFSLFGLNGVEYWHIKGLTVRNGLQRGLASRRPQGFGATNSANMTWENCTSHNIEARGFYYESGAWNTWDAEYAAALAGHPGTGIVYAIWSNDTTRWINCDTYNICDFVNGSSGDGWKCGNYYGGVMSWEGCRAWNYSDDGFDPSGAGRRVFNRCWAYPTNLYEGRPSMEGNGFKTSGIGADQIGHVPTDYDWVEVTNCIAADCYGIGFYNNLEAIYGDGDIQNNAKYYNNLVYQCYSGFGDTYHYGVPRTSIYRNNIAFDNYGKPPSYPNYEQVQIYTPAALLVSNNTWIADTGGYPNWNYNPAISVSNADFESLDVTQLIRPRKSDGSLPDITFGHLAAGSDLIGAGIRIQSSLDGVDLVLDGVNNPYSNPPSLGPFEYGTAIVYPSIPNVRVHKINIIRAVVPSGLIVADHNAIAQFDLIPQIWINEVKKMWVSMAGESHSGSYRFGAQLLEDADAKYAVSIIDGGAPEQATDQHLRLSRATWGDVDNATGWIYDYGEEDWWTSAAAIARTKAGLQYCHNNNYGLTAISLGWCWDCTWHNGLGGGTDPVYNCRWAGSSVGGPQGDLRWGLDSGDQALTGNSVCMQTYIDATQSYVDYCTTNNIPTKIIWSTGPVDNDASMAVGEIGYQQFLKYQYLRNYVGNLSNAFFIDFADILSYGNDNETQNTTSWTDMYSVQHVFPLIHDDNMDVWNNQYHFGSAGAIKVAKALWWLLARMAGWDGN